MKTRILGSLFALILSGLLAAGTHGCTRGGSTVSDCQDGRTLCGGACVDTSGDPENCGACGTVCAADELCDAGNCWGLCPEGLAACGPDPSDCADLTSDHDNCGACGISCGAQVCDQGNCANTCSSPATDCDGTCIDTSSDPENCGSCGFVCSLPNADPACAGGHCAIGACTANFGDCDGDPANGCEADVAQDDLNCGQCGNSCASGISCGSGECQSPGAMCGGVTCPIPQLCCRSGGSMGGTFSCYDPDSQVCSGSVLECDGSSDCAAGEVCCRDTAIDPYGATCTSTCSDTVLCSQSSDCSVAAPYCCPTGGMMVTENICEINPC